MCVAHPLAEVPVGQQVRAVSRRGTGRVASTGAGFVQWEPQTIGWKTWRIR